jgi:hypothetical protein
MKRRKKKHQMYKQYDLKEIQQFTLCEAMRYGGHSTTRKPEANRYQLY